MKYRHPFMIATDALFAALDAASAKQNKLLHKLEQADDLRKGNKAVLSHLHEIKDMVDGLNRDMDELHKLADARRASLPSFGAYLRNEIFPKTQPISGPLRDMGNFAVASKAIGATGGVTMEQLPTAPPPPIDPSKNVASTMLNHQRYQRD